ncbi:MAG TPA: dihydrodipicolinate synthase family protein [bacterium]
MTLPMPPKAVTDLLKRGIVIPAHPLALDAQRKLDVRRQRALSRYYLAAGAGGLAVGVHTTQFEIRQHGLFEPVLQLAADTMREVEQRTGRTVVKIAGVIGPTTQAVAEARQARELGYHAGLLSLAALKTATDKDLIVHARAVATEIPLVGFYLQPSVGGRPLSFRFWREFAEIENVVAIKMAPFNRYQTQDVIRAVHEAGRAYDIALYTGNDDNILLDLLTTHRFGPEGTTGVRVLGGLLGHWAVWTEKAVQHLERVHALLESGDPIPQDLLTLAGQVTDANSAFFDSANSFAGCIAGIHEVLRRQGLMAGRWTLNPKEEMSPGQMEEIDRVYAAYPHLNDDAFVKAHVQEWLA